MISSITARVSSIIGEGNNVIFFILFWYSEEYSSIRTQFIVMIGTVLFPVSGSTVMVVGNVLVVILMASHDAFQVVWTLPMMLLYGQGHKAESFSANIHSLYQP